VSQRSGLGRTWDRSTYLRVPKIHNNDEYSSLFGCHVAVRDVAPGFRVREMMGGREVAYRVLIASFPSRVVPSWSCVSVRWVRMNVERGGTDLGVLHYTTTTNVGRRLVATSPSTTWHLDSLLESSVAGGS
jgi:hypothetical protein